MNIVFYNFRNAIKVAIGVGIVTGIIFMGGGVKTIRPATNVHSQRSGQVMKQPTGTKLLVNMQQK